MGEGAGGGDPIAPIPPILAFPRQGEGTFTYPCEPVEGEGKDALDEQITFSSAGNCQDMGHTWPSERGLD